MIKIVNCLHPGVPADQLGHHHQRGDPRGPCGGEGHCCSHPGDWEPQHHQVDGGAQNHQKPNLHPCQVPDCHPDIQLSCIEDHQSATKKVQSARKAKREVQEEDCQGGHCWGHPRLDGLEGRKRPGKIEDIPGEPTAPTLPSYCSGRHPNLSPSNVQCTEDGLNSCPGSPRELPGLQPSCWGNHEGAARTECHPLRPVHQGEEQWVGLQRKYPDNDLSFNDDMNLA